MMPAESGSARTSNQSESGPAAGLQAGSRSAAPLFVLAPPRSFSSIVSAMIGQHPQAYSLPETHLFGADTVAQWWAQCAVASHTMDHGLLRTVAELFFGGQTEETVVMARGWLRRRAHFSTGYLLEKLGEQVSPRLLVEKSPSLVYSREALARVFRLFPRARFVHLVRHPRGQGASVMRRIELAGRRRAVPQWMTDLASFPVQPQGAAVAAELDPQGGWFVLNLNICQFLDSIPSEQWKVVRSEEVLTRPDEILAEVAGWLGLESDSAAVERMKHPEASAFSCPGPPGAELGNDPVFLHKPVLRPSRAESHSLEGPLEWRGDGGGFAPAVKELARRFGYS